IVTELADFVSRFPARERLRYLLILALYRCDRQADALAAYRDAHRFLDEEFGISPGESLEDLHRRVLQSDPTLMTVGMKPTPPPPAAPVAPAGNPFVGSPYHLVDPALRG